MTPRQERSPSLKLADLELDRLVFEVRYPTAFLHWDRAGSVWTTFRNEYEDLEAVEVAPADVRMAVADTYEVSSGTESARVVCYGRGEFEDFAVLSRRFLDLVVDRLELYEFSRVGFSPIYGRDYPNRESAAAAVMALGLIVPPAGPQFQAESEPLLPQVGLRYETDAYGVTVNIKAEDQRFRFRPRPAHSMLVAKESERHRLVVVLDYFTLGTVAATALDAEEWLRQGNRLLQKGAEAFLAQGRGD